MLRKEKKGFQYILFRKPVVTQCGTENPKASWRVLPAGLHHSWALSLILHWPDDLLLSNSAVDVRVQISRLGHRKPCGIFQASGTCFLGKLANHSNPTSLSLLCCEEAQASWGTGPLGEMPAILSCTSHPSWGVWGHISTDAMFNMTRSLAMDCDHTQKAQVKTAQLSPVHPPTTRANPIVLAATTFWCQQYITKYQRQIPDKLINVCEYMSKIMILLLLLLMFTSMILKICFNVHFLKKYIFESSFE